MDREDWHLLLFLLSSHHRPEKLHRTIHVSFRGKDIYLCARCTGIFSGIFSVFAAWFLGFTLPVWLYPPLLSVLPAPSAVDWITQSCKLRESRNVIRVSTGYILGIGEGLFLLILINHMLYPSLLGFGVLGVYVFIIYVIAKKTKFLDSYIDEQTSKIP